MVEQNKNDSLKGTSNKSISKGKGRASPKNGTFANVPNVPGSSKSHESEGFNEKTKSSLSSSEMCMMKLVVQLKKFNKNFAKYSEDTDLLSYRVNKAINTIDNLTKSVDCMERTTYDLSSKVEDLTYTNTDLFGELNNLKDGLKNTNNIMKNLNDQVDNLDYETEKSNDLISKNNDLISTNNSLVSEHNDLFKNYMNDVCKNNNCKNDEHKNVNNVNNVSNSFSNEKQPLGSSEFDLKIDPTQASSNVYENFDDMKFNLEPPKFRRSYAMDLSTNTYLNDLSYSLQNNSQHNSQNSQNKSHNTPYNSPVQLYKASKSEPDDFSYFSKSGFESLTKAAQRIQKNEFETNSESSSETTYSDMPELISVNGSDSSSSTDTLVLESVPDSEIESVRNDSLNVSFNDTGAGVGLNSFVKMRPESLVVKNEKRFPPSYMDLSRWALYQMKVPSTLEALKSCIVSEVPNAKKGKVNQNVTHEKLMRFNVKLAHPYMKYDDKLKTYSLTETGKKQGMEVDITQFNKSF